MVAAEKREKHTKYMRIWRARNRDRHNELARESYQRNKHKHVDRGWDLHLKRRYGLNTVIYNAMVEAQNGLCAICQKPPKNNKLHVDHCHVTGKIRSLLCVRCNTALAWFEEHGDAAQEYVRK